MLCKLSLYSIGQLVTICKPDFKKYLLEIGCGVGTNLRYIKNMYKNAELYGIDKNINVLSIASTFIKTQLSNIENMNLEYEKEFFDFILVGNILQQFRNPQDIIKYLESFLNNKGKLLIGGLDSGILL